MDVLVDNRNVFVSGFLVTFQLCVLTAAGALVIGTLVAAMRISPVAPLRWLGTTYVNIFRNLPLTIVFFLTGALFTELGAPGANLLKVPGLSVVFTRLGIDLPLTIVFFLTGALFTELGAPGANFLKVPGLSLVFTRLGIDLPYFRFAVVALSVYTAAFVCEAIRAGVNAVPPGQAEAARSLGLTFVQNLRYIVLPQAWRASVVPVGSALIAMIKNSALAGAFGVTGELFSSGVALTSAAGYPIVPVLVGVSIGYLIMTIPLGLLLDRLERRRAYAR